MASGISMYRHHRNAIMASSRSMAQRGIEKENEMKIK